jgi:hypothetical protein
VAARCKASVCGRSLAGIVGLNLAGGKNVSCQCFLLSGRKYPRRPEKSYRVWCLCDREASTLRRPQPSTDCCVMRKKIFEWFFIILLITFSEEPNFLRVIRNGQAYVCHRISRLFLTVARFPIPTAQVV